MIKTDQNIYNKALKLWRGMLLFSLIAGVCFNSSATSYSSSAVTQITSLVTAGATDQQVLRVAITTSGGGAAVHICSMDFVMNNSTTPTNAKLYYTASSTTFATTTQLGSTVVSPTGTINFTFDQSHGSGSTWYYWLAFDIPGGAPDCSTFDASFATNGLTYGASCPGASFTTPTTPDPAGVRTLEAPGCWNYCSSVGTTNTAGHISNVNFNTVNRTSTFDGYINTGTSTSVYRGVSYDLTVEKTNNAAYTTYTAAWIDWDNDGIFNATDEYVLTSASTAAASGVTSRTVNIAIPGTAVLGVTRMRVFFKYNTTISTDGCDNGTIYEDVEDFDINILAPTACSGTPTTPVIAISSSAGCVSASESLSATTYDINADLTYQWQSSTDGGTTWGDLGASSTIAPTTPFGITPAVDTDYRLSVTCANGGLSSNSSSVSYVVTITPACFCTPTGNLNCTVGDYIANVTFGTINRTSTCDAGGYVNTGASTDAIIGQTYTFTIKNGTVGAANAAVWFDWNHDLDFADSDLATPEFQLVVGANGISANEINSIDVTVPADATAGVVVMRVRRFYNLTPTSTMSCTSAGTYGETEDYIVNIRVANPGGSYGIYIDEVGATTTLIDPCEIVASEGILIGSQDGDENYAITYVTGMTDITVDNISCINVALNVSTTEGAPDWTGSTAPLAGTGQPKSVTYTTVGKKSIVLSPDATYEETLYEEDFEGASSGWTGQATSTPGSSQNYWIMGSLTTAKSGWYSGGVAGCGANNTALTGNYSPRISYYKSGNPGAGLYCSYSAAAVATTNLRLYSKAFSTAAHAGNVVTLEFNYVGVMNADDNVQLQYSTDGAAWTDFAGELYNGSVATTTLRSVILPAGAKGQATVYIGWNFNSTTTATSAPPTFIIDDITVKATTSITNEYTDFMNFLMDIPGAGTVVSNSEVCSDISNDFSSSEAGTPGYEYVWSTADPAGVVATIATTTGSATGISFNNTTTGDLVSTVTLNLTSGCCGPLGAINTTVTVHPLPVAVTVNDASPTNCEGGSYSMNVTPTTANTTYIWYDAATVGNILGAGTSYLEPSVANGTTNYYVEATSDDGCVNPARTLVAVTSNDPVPTGIDVSFCSNGTFTMNVTDADNTVFKWYDAAAAGNLLGTGTAYDFNVTCTPACTESVWVSASLDDCDESTRDQVDVVLSVPTPPTTWDGSTDNDWFDQNNWSSCVPECGLDALIPDMANDPNISFTGTVATVQSITVESGAALTFSDIKSRLEVCGDFTHEGVVTMVSKGTVAFNSTDASQVYTKTGGTGDLYIVEIDNTHSTPTVDIGDEDMVIATDGSLNLVNGRINTDVGEYVIVKNTAGSSVSSSGNSWVNGNLKRFVVASADPYNFPVGNANSYQLFQLDNTSNISGGLTDLTVSFSNPANWNTNAVWPINEGFSGSYTTILNNGGASQGTGHANGGVWTATPNAGSIDYDVMLVGTNYDNHLVAHSVLKRTTAGPGAWAVVGANGGEIINGTISLTTTRTGLSGFSEFGEGVSGTPLSIELGDFIVECVNKKVVINWVTSSEINNDKFIIERSADNKNWNVISEVVGAGNSNQNTPYNYVDNTTDSKGYFYRLVQVDFDGKTSIASNEVFIDNCNDNFIGNSSVYVYDQKTIAVLIDGVNESGKADLIVFDVTGKEVLHNSFNISKNIINRFEVNESTIAEGIYFIRVTTSSGLTLNKKVLLGN